MSACQALRSEQAELLGLALALSALAVAPATMVDDLGGAVRRPIAAGRASEAGVDRRQRDLDMTAALAGY